MSEHYNADATCCKPIPIECGAYMVTAGVIAPPSDIVRTTVFSAVIEAARANGEDPAKILSRDRSLPVSAARHHAFYIAKGNGLSLSEIGRNWGYDHTTVLHGLRAHAARNGLEAGL